jgi:ribosome-associated toxin RatA of RatAB toxin-antitoxin module
VHILSKGVRTERKKKRKGPRHHSVALPSDDATETNRWPFSVVKPQAGKGVVIPCEVFVAAGAQQCFDTITRQLEDWTLWDPMVLDVKPVSHARGQTGSTSRLTFNLGGQRFVTLAMVCLCDPPRTIAWVSNDKIKITEEWRLKPKSNGTLVNFALHYTFSGAIGGLRGKLVRRKKVERIVHQMVNRLKAVAESKDKRNESSAGEA